MFSIYLHHIHTCEDCGNPVSALTVHFDNEPVWLKPHRMDGSESSGEFDDCPGSGREIAWRGEDAFGGSEGKPCACWRCYREH